MDHGQLQRPVLPGTTPAPGPKGMKTVYSRRDGNSSPYPPPPAAQDTPTRSSTNMINSGNEDLQSGASAMSLTSSQQRKVEANTDRLNQRLMQQKVMTKIVSKLPFQLRESVSAVLTMAFSTSENIQKDLDVSHQEVMALRAELFKRSSEVSSLRKTCAIYQEQLRGLRENVESLKDNVEARQKFTIKNRSAMTRLAATNRMLIDALDALQNNSSGNNVQNNNNNNNNANEMLMASTPLSQAQRGLANQSTNSLLHSQSTSTITPFQGDAAAAEHAKNYPPKTHQLKPLTVNNVVGTKSRSVSASPEALEAMLLKSPSQAKLDVDGENTLILQKQYQEKQQQMTLSQNDKLRESLLKIAREHYRSLKTSEHLQGKVSELTTALKRQEHISRKLQTELEEYKRANELASPFSVSEAGSLANGHDHKPSIKFSTAAMVAVAALKTEHKIHHPAVIPGHPHANNNNNNNNNNNTTSGTTTANAHKAFSASSSIARALRHHHPPRDRFGILDDRLAQLVARGMVDPTEAVLTLRRIIQRVVICGNHLVSPANNNNNQATASGSSSVNVSLSLREMIRDVADRDTAAVFRTDAVNLYLLKPSVENNNGHNVTSGPPKIRYSMQKFSSYGSATVPAGHPETFEDLGDDLRGSKSLAVQTMRTGKAMRLNIITMNSLFDKVIDGAGGGPHATPGSGIQAKRLLAVPLFASSDVKHMHNINGSLQQTMPAALGCLVFVNKHASIPAATTTGDGETSSGNAGISTIIDNEPFSEVDEVLALIFAQMISLLLMNSIKYDALFHHSQMLRSLLQSGPDLLHHTLHDSDLDASALAVPPVSQTTILDTSTGIVKHEPVIASAQAQTQLLQLLSSVHPAEVLVALEDMAVDVLQCPLARAYLVTPTTNIHSLLRNYQAENKELTSDALEQLYSYNYYSAMSSSATGTDDSTNNNNTCQKQASFEQQMARFEWLYLDPQNRRSGLGANSRSHPKRLRTARAPLGIGLVGQLLCPKSIHRQPSGDGKKLHLPQSVLIPQALTSLEFDPEVDVDSALLATRPLLIIPLIDTSDEVGRVYGAVEIIPPLQPSPRFNNTVSQESSHDDFRLLFTQAADWFAHQLTSSALPLLFKRLGYTPSLSSIPMSILAHHKDKHLEDMEEHFNQGQSMSKRHKNLSFMSTSTPSSPEGRAMTPASQGGGLSRTSSSQQMTRPIATPTRISKGSNSHDSSTNAYYSRSASFSMIAGAATDFDVVAINPKEVTALQEHTAGEGEGELHDAPPTKTEDNAVSHHSHHHHHHHAKEQSHAQHEFLITTIKKLEHDLGHEQQLKETLKEEIDRLTQEIARLKTGITPKKTNEELEKEKHHEKSRVEQLESEMKQLKEDLAKKQASWEAQVNELQALLDEESNARSELYHQHATLNLQHNHHQTKIAELEEALLVQHAKAAKSVQDAVTPLHAQITQLQQEVNTLTALNHALEKSLPVNADGMVLPNGDHGSTSNVGKQGASHHGKAPSSNRMSSKDHNPHHAGSISAKEDPTAINLSNKVTHQQQLLTEKEEQFQHAKSHWEEEVRQRDQIIHALQDQIQKLSQKTLKEIDSAWNGQQAVPSESKKESLVPASSSTSHHPSIIPTTDPFVPGTIAEEPSVHETSPSYKELDPEKNAVISQQQQQQQQQEEDDFAKVWYKLFDTSQNAWYYCHAVTGETSWTVPEDPSVKIIEQTSDVPADAAVDATATAVESDDWELKFDEASQRPYYLNKVTGESSWTHPSVAGTQGAVGEGDMDEEDEDGFGGGRRNVAEGGEDDIFATNMSQWSAAAGDYTIDL